MKRFGLRIYGRVQGVYFRESTRKEAERLGVRGWVRNVPDGSVEALVEGDEAQVDALIRWCHRGPPAARVDDVKLREEPLGGPDLPHPFEVRR